MAATGLYATERLAGVMWGADDFPWAVVAAGCFGVLMIWESIRIFTSKKDDAPVTVGKLNEALTARDLEIRSVRKTIEALDMKPLGAEGASVATLPNGTNAVKMPDGTIRLALPKKASIRFSAGVPTVTVSGRAVKASDDD